MLTNNEIEEMAHKMARSMGIKIKSIEFIPIRITDSGIHSTEHAKNTWDSMTKKLQSLNPCGIQIYAENNRGSFMAFNDEYRGEKRMADETLLPMLEQITGKDRLVV